jgi:phi13 family phage major tail protein
MGSAPKKIGVDMVHVAKVTSDVRGSTPTFDTPVWLPELKSLGVKVQSSMDKFYSDNGLSEVFPTVSGAQISVSIAGLSMNSKRELQGLSDATGPGVLGDTTETPNPVAFGYRRWMSGKTSDGRQRYRYVWIFKALFAPPDDEGDTHEDKTNVSLDSLSGESMPLDAYQPSHCYWQYTYDNWEDGATQALDDAFFEAVKGIPAVA